MLSLSFNHYKPEDINRMGFDSQSSQGGDSDIGEGNDSLDQFGGKKTSKFDYDQFFSKEVILSRFRGDVSNEHVSNEKLRLMPPGYLHEIDFKTYHPRAVYQFATDYSKGHLISDLENPTFYEQLGVFFEEAFRINRHF